MNEKFYGTVLDSPKIIDETNISDNDIAK